MEETLQLVSDWTRLHTKKELAQKLGSKLPFGPVQDAKDLFEDPHVAAREMLVAVDHPGAEKQYHIPNTPIKMTKTKGGVRTRAPLLGEHTDIILKDYGLNEEQIAELRAKNIIQ